MSKTSIWPIDETQSDATASGKSEPGSNGNERILCISKRSRAEALLSDSLVLYLGNSLVRRSYSSAEM